MKILVVDGQGGKMGKAIIEKIKNVNADVTVIAVGTNCIATSAMLKSGADYVATGENPIIVNSSKVDFIIGPIGIVLVDSFLGEVTKKMTVAICRSKAKKILIPVNKCNTVIASVKEGTANEYINNAVETIFK